MILVDCFILNHSLTPCCSSLLFEVVRDLGIKSTRKFSSRLVNEGLFSFLSIKRGGASIGFVMERPQFFWWIVDVDAQASRRTSLVSPVRAHMVHALVQTRCTT